MAGVTGKAPDVLIVGGGVMGCSVAGAGARRGLAVTVLERAVPGAEASSAAAGILGAQADVDQPGPFLNLCLHSRALYAEWAPALQEATSIDVGYGRCGVLHLVFDEHEATVLGYRAERQQAAGLRAEPLDHAQVCELVPVATGPHLGGIWFPDDGQVDNQRLVPALAMACERAGVRFVTGRPVDRVVARQGRVAGVEAGGESFPAGAVVVCAGAWTSLVPGLELPARAIRPIRGQMVELSLRAPAFSPVVYGPDGYLVPRRDGRILCGSTLEDAGYLKAVTLGGLRDIGAMATRLVPVLEGAAVHSTWAGLRPVSATGDPLLGETATRGLYVASGHYRNGILLAPATAEAMAALLVGDAPAVDVTPFAPV